MDERELGLSEGGEYVPSQRERENLKREIEEMKMRSRDKITGDAFLNDKKFRAELAYKERRYNDLQPRSYSKNEMDRLKDKAKREIDEYRKRAQTVEEGDNPTTQNVHKAMAYMKTQSERDSKLKSLLSSIDPDDPDASNLLKYRKEYGRSEF